MLRLNLVHVTKTNRRSLQGFIVSDWNAQHAGVATALAGLDMAMPDDQGFWGNSLIDAVKNGSVPEARVDDMAIRYGSRIPLHCPQIY